MTIQTINTRPTDTPDPVDPFQAGIRDARNEATTLGLDIIWARAQWMIDPAYTQHTDASYLLGYTSTLAALTNQIPIEIALAYVTRGIDLP